MLKCAIPYDVPMFMVSFVVVLFHIEIPYLQVDYIDFMPHPVGLMLFSNISQIRLRTVAWYDFVSKRCDCSSRLIWFQFAEYVTLIVIRWGWTTRHKSENGPVQCKMVIKLVGIAFYLQIPKEINTYLLLTGTSPVTRILQRRSSGSRPQWEMLLAG